VRYEIDRRTYLDVMRDLPDDVEDWLEGEVPEEWSAEDF